MSSMIYDRNFHHINRMSYIRKVILNNWLINPTGKPLGFRGVDWLVELNNLYTKVIFGGSGSNYTIDRVIEESILIDIYRHCHVIVENGFYLVNRTIRHAPPDMTKTLEALSRQYRQAQPHIFNRGRRAKCVVADHMMIAMDIYAHKKQMMKPPDDEVMQVDVTVEVMQDFEPESLNDGVQIEAEDLI